MAGCGTGDAPLQVGPVVFEEAELRGLGENQLRTLVRLTSIGLSAREGDSVRVGEALLQGRLDQARIQRLREEVALEQAEVSDAALEVHYQSAPEWELEVRHLVVLSERWRTDAHRSEARSKAEAARNRVLQGEDFAEVAGDVSEEPGARERGGRLEPGREGTWVAEFWDAAVQLEPGGISPVVESEYGFHVIELDDRREVPFEEARDRVAAELAARVSDRTAWESWMEDLFEDRPIESIEPPGPRGGGTAGFDPDEPPAGVPLLPASTDSSVVARWPGGRLTAGEFGIHLSTRSAADVRAAFGADEGVRDRLVEEAARDRMLLAEAERRGIEVPDPVAARITREWERTLDGWAALFGFEAGASPREVREQAVTALTEAGQNFRIARDEIDRVGHALDGAYPVRRRGLETGGGP